MRFGVRRSSAPCPPPRMKIRVMVGTRFALCPPYAFHAVMRGLEPRIHVSLIDLDKNENGRVKPSHDACPINRSRG
jgi:hypothetical protein